MVKLSTVFGTLNRIELLKPCLESIRASAQGLDHEIIIVDGGSTDGTLEFLREQQVTFIEQGERLGAVKAFNAGFAAAQGEYVCNLNDDCQVVGDTLKLACDYLDTHPLCGQVAIPFGDGGTFQTQIVPNRYAQLFGKKNVPYANFGVTRKELGDKFGWWGRRLPADKALYQYGGDVFLSIMVWLSRHTVDTLEDGKVVHFQTHDETRVPNVESSMLDKIFMAGRAVAHEREETQRKTKTNAREEARREAERMRAKRMRAKRTVPKETQSLVNPTRVRYLGGHRTLALFTDTPSGRVYRIKLKARQEFYVSGSDAEYFLAKQDEHGAMFERAQ